jgi:hypothetical protein
MAGYDHNMTNKRRHTPSAKIVAHLALIFILGSLGACRGRQIATDEAVRTPQPTIALPASPPTVTPPPTPRPLNSLPSILAQVPFPTRPLEYPPDWPAALVYPQQFILVDASAGKLPGGTSQTWATKFRFSGQPADAIALLTSHWGANDWQVLDRQQLTGDGTVLLITSLTGDTSGMLVVDSEPGSEGATIVIATFFEEPDSS